MGVQGLWGYINRHHADLYRDASGDLTAHGAVYGVDTSLYMYQLAFKSDGVAPVEQFLEQADEFRLRGVVPVYLFDGADRKVKQHEHARRREANDKLVAHADKRAVFLNQVEAATAPVDEAALRAMVASHDAPPDVRRALERNTVMELPGVGPITVEVDVPALLGEVRDRHERDAPVREAGGIVVPPAYFDAVREAFDRHGIGYYVAKGDAEKLGAQLTREGKIDVLVTDDGDAIPFGTTVLLRNLFRSGRNGMQVLVIAELLARLGLSREQFVDVCVMCGCDYTESRGIPSIGPAKAIAIVKKHGSLAAYLGSLDWQAKHAWILRQAKTADFTMEQFQHEVARATFLDDSPQTAFVSDAVVEAGRGGGGDGAGAAPAGAPGGPEGAVPTEPVQ